jgi:hypothetical protein
MVAIGVMERALATAPMRAEKSKPVFFMLHPVANLKAIVLGSTYLEEGEKHAIGRRSERRLGR